MRSSVGSWIFALVVVLAAALFTRLGVWQLDRRAERRAVNERRTERLERPTLRLSSLPSPAEIDWRRVELRGRYDYSREIVLRNRSRRGAPGVYVITPLLLGTHGDSAGSASTAASDSVAASDSIAVPVLRGWLPAADATHADLAEGRPAGPEDPASVEIVEGVALTGTDEHPGPVDTLRSAGGRHPVLGAAHVATIRELLPYPTAGFLVRAGARSRTRSLPRPIPVPELDEGPHLMYAVQWFSFAIIAVVGGGIFLWKRREGGS